MTLSKRIRNFIIKAGQKIGLELSTEAHQERAALHITFASTIALIAARLNWWGVGLVVVYLAIFVVQAEIVESKWQSKRKTVTDVLTKTVPLFFVLWG